MDRIYYSIFNDVLGPIMTGPSSSHSAGCARIGRTVRDLAGHEILRADVVFEEQGSYPSTYIGQGSNFGFTGGLLGYAADDPRLKDSVEIAKKEGRSITFQKAPLGFLHPNQALIGVYDAQGNEEMTLMTFSIGGGMFQITEMDGFPVYIDGGMEQVFILCLSAGAADSVKAYLASLGLPCQETENGSRRLVNVKPPYGTGTAPLAALRDWADVAYVRYAKPVLPVVKRQREIPPFFTSGEALAFQTKTGAAPWQLALDYECGYGHVTVENVWQLAGNVLAAMRGSIVSQVPEPVTEDGFLAYPAKRMERTPHSSGTVDTGLLQKALLAAVTVMENSCARGIVVAAPTAGSSGVVPAAVVCIGDQLGRSDEEICKALLTAGLTGVFIANQATFGGEVGACQAENGSASAMAASGVVQLLGGSAEQCFQAASLAMQNMLGLICDPVAGMTEVPCISRNVSAMSNAILSANMVMLGFDPVIPLDETILTMKDVGQALPAELRCTCRGGLCTTPTGCRLSDQASQRHPAL